MSPNGSVPSSTEDDPYALPRRRMVERQLRRRGIEDERVLAAMEQVPRERFVPESQRRRAYRDGALPIGEGQTISQPWIVARMTAALELEGVERVLEVGTGLGLRRGGAVALLLARGHRRAPARGWPSAPRRCPRRPRLSQRRGAHRRRVARGARPRSLRRHPGDRRRRARPARGARWTSWPRARRSSARSTAAGTSGSSGCATARPRPSLP